MYEGTGYFGFAKQSDVPTVEGEITRSLKSLCSEEIRVFGASRTDRGVHALGQVASFKTEGKIKTADFTNALNFFLPSDIRILSSEDVPDGFHARFSARGKEYVYSVFIGREVPFYLRKYALHLRRGIDIPAIEAAAAHLIGEHDFSSFAQEIKGSPTRKIESIKIFEKSEKLGCLLEFHFRGNSFLYKMIRTIMGTLLEVGAGKKTPAEVFEILKARDRKRAGATAPPQGLCLIGVNYGE
jgi:tRNA pseudouridine38-40 synthase